MTLDELRERMRGWIEGEYEVVVFLVEGRRVAYAVWQIQEDSVFLRQFFVVRNRRRQGIGQGAARILIEEIFPDRIPVNLDVLPHNEAGLRFWRALGFQDHLLTLERHPENP